MFAFLTLATGALAFNATTTVEKVYTTIECSAPTTLAYGNNTYTVTEATTLTVEDCGCTHSAAAVATSANLTAPAQNSSNPAIANGAVAGKVGAAAGVAAAVAFLI